MKSIGCLTWNLFKDQFKELIRHFIIIIALLLFWLCKLQGGTWVPQMNTAYFCLARRNRLWDWLLSVLGNPRYGCVIIVSKASSSNCCYFVGSYWTMGRRFGRDGSCWNQVWWFCVLLSTLQLGEMAVLSSKQNVYKLRMYCSLPETDRVWYHIALLPRSSDERNDCISLASGLFQSDIAMHLPFSLLVDCKYFMKLQDHCPLLKWKIEYIYLAAIITWY